MGSGPVGIDVERITQRLHRVADKFLTREETGSDPAVMSTEALCLHWCAKEALYKLYGERLLDFRDHMRVIDPPGILTGEFTGLISNGVREARYRLSADRIEDYFLVYARSM